MNIQQLGVITLVRSALTGRKLELPEGFELDESLKTAKEHQIQSMIYYGAVNCGIPDDSNVMHQLFMSTCQLVAVNERQMYKLSELMTEFDKNGIDYMPLKGTILKKMYPKPELRPMCDADILIKLEQYEKIKEIMVSLGFIEGDETGHELNWYCSNVHFELHKSLMPPQKNKDIFPYFVNCWDNAVKSSDSSSYRYEMQQENQLIYLFTHLAKHYRNGGVGIRHITDMWVYKNSLSAIDEDYIKAELEKIKLYDFYVNVMHTVDVWFGNKPSDKMSDFITQVIFDSGAYGKAEMHWISNGVINTKASGSSNKTYFNSIFYEIFLPYKNMCERYPILIKVPVLLPIMWVVRWVDALLFRRKTISQKATRINYVTSDKIDSYQASLDYVGLDFNFKE